MNTEKVICLGKEFTTENEPREFFRRDLRTKLPEIKKIEGFPIVEDEDSLSQAIVSSNVVGINHN